MLKLSKYLILLILISSCQQSVIKSGGAEENCPIPIPTYRQCFTNVPTQRTQNTIFMLVAGADVGELTKTSSDLKSFGQAMQNHFKIPQTQICQLPNAFKAEMESAFQSLNTLVAPNDLVIIYFSGHGTKITDNNGDEKDGADEMLVTYDSKCKSKPKKDNGWRDDDFVSVVNNLPTARVLTVMDTCYSSGMILGPNSLQLKNARSKFFVKGELGVIEHNSKPDKSNVIRTEVGNLDSLKGLLLAAASEKQEALEVDEGGLFTIKLLENFSNDLKQAFSQAVEYIETGTQNSQMPQAVGNWDIIEEHPSIWDIAN